MVHSFVLSHFQIFVVSSIESRIHNNLVLHFRNQEMFSNFPCNRLISPIWNVRNGHLTPTLFGIILRFGDYILFHIGYVLLCYDSLKRFRINKESVVYHLHKWQKCLHFQMYQTITSTETLWMRKKLYHHIIQVISRYHLRAIFRISFHQGLIVVRF